AGLKIIHESILPMNQLRRILYRLGSWLGWLNAIQKGTVGQRVARVYAYKGVSKILRKVIK
ncbi:MAG: hypothetical protein QM520_05800, partial [Gammaproteobacteria bacterium]|nr:hypothetical protein [Gammaproteobacteria bacterium]